MSSFDKGLGQGQALGHQDQVVELVPSLAGLKSQVRISSSFVVISVQCLVYFSC